MCRDNILFRFLFTFRWNEWNNKIKIRNSELSSKSQEMDVFVWVWRAHLQKNHKFIIIIIVICVCVCACVARSAYYILSQRIDDFKLNWLNYKIENDGSGSDDDDDDINKSRRSVWQWSWIVCLRDCVRILVCKSMAIHHSNSNDVIHKDGKTINPRHKQMREKNKLIQIDLNICEKWCIRMWGDVDDGHVEIKKMFNEKCDKSLGFLRQQNKNK